MIVGVLGGGQLARMLALSGYPLGLSFVFYDPSGEACARCLGKHFQGAYDNHSLLEKFLEAVDVVTYEFENIPIKTVQYISSRKPLFPSVQALSISQDRVLEKEFLKSLEIPVPSFISVTTDSCLVAASKELGFPFIVKTRRDGYDGKGQFSIRNDDDLKKFRLQYQGAPLIAESYVNFDREISIIGVRGKDGSSLFYPLSENIHRDGILRISFSRPGDSMERVARSYLERIMVEWNYVGVAALELFEKGGILFANELAPRVHNSCHWSIEGAQTNQFENHVRAIVGLPLGDVSAIGLSAMVNCIGQLPDAQSVAAVPSAHVHFYGKAARPLRKVGHVTVRAESEAQRRFLVRKILRIMPGENLELEGKLLSS